MKRPVVEHTVSSLQDLIVCTIVSEFGSEIAFRLYLSGISNDTVKELLTVAWKKKTDPAEKLHSTYRRFVKARLEVTYLDTKELTHGYVGTVSITLKRHFTPLEVDDYNCKQALFSEALSHLQGTCSQSSLHKGPRFVLKFGK